MSFFFVKNGGNFGREKLNILEAQIFFMKIRSCK